MQSLPFQKVEHQVATLDAQPSNQQGGILVAVSGALLVRLSSDDPLPLNLFPDTSYLGRGGEASHELRPDIPAAARRERQLLHLQRRLPSRIPSLIEDVRNRVHGAASIVRKEKKCSRAFAWSS